MVKHLHRIKWFKKISLILYFIVTSSWVCGQPVTPIEELDYTIEEFTLPGGRAGNNVNAIVQGPYGFMWFGSHGGLHRYDGYEFVTYKPVASDTIGETTTLTDPYVENLYWDSNNILWVTSYGGGLFRFDPITEKFKHYKHDPKDSTSISHPRVLCAVEDAKGNLWIGTEHGLNLFDRSTGKSKRYFADPDIPGSLHHDDIRTLYVDKEGTLWVGTGWVLYGTAEGGLSRYNSESDSFTNFIYDPADEKSIWTSAVRGLLEDSRGNFWVGTIKGLQKMNRNEGIFERMGYNPSQPYAPGVNDLESQPVYSILEDKKGALWVGIIDFPSYSSHLIRYDTVLKKSQAFPLKSSVWQLCESTDGTIWAAGAGTSGKVQKIIPKARTYELLTDVSVIRDAYADSKLSKELGGVPIGPINLTVNPQNGNYWLQLIISSSYDPSSRKHLGLVLAEYNPRSMEMSFHLLDLEIQDLDYNSFAVQIGMSGLLVDNKGNVWGSFYADNIGVFCYDPSSGSLKQYLHDANDPGSISSNEINTMIMDSRGEVWAAAFENGLNRINPATGVVTQYHFNGLGFGETDHPIALLEGRNGQILVAGNFSYEGTSFIVEIDPETNALRKILLPEFQGNWIITGMTQSVLNGSLVLALGGNIDGLAIFNEDHNEIFFPNTEYGFPFSNIAGVVSDRHGIFWAADAESSKFVRFSNQDSFLFEEAGNKPTQWRSGILGANGKIYFLTWQGGWVEIDPELITPEVASESSKIQLVDLFILGEKQKPRKSTILDKPIWLMEEIVLPPDAENFGFRFSNLDFQNRDTQFNYRLYPYEEEWNRTGYLPSANYYRVPYGEYTFQVRSVGMTSNIEGMLEMKVVILPPWWRTWWAYGGYGFIFIAGVFVVDRVQRRRLLAKANAEAKEKELEQAREIEKAYTELKATQSQLIQSEKMASLGELTAGIAHEIQNPLNFVNNFSEVNEELLNEMKDDLLNGKTNEAIALANDAIENQKKIYNHGKRADAIVKGMLQHSRGGNDVKELTDINALADEYLRLAYHGLRAKDKSFNATMKTEFDEALDKINVVPQDIGRVILNLITNAFYAVSEKAKEESDKDYMPTVTVSTKGVRNSVEISVSDNGKGIPAPVREKIFQPFFTTKPTGQGTGLGLSMSYDIVKAHGGELQVETEEGRGSEFIIQLPIV